jgi:uncharacterized radical SAM superfamily Fe-S cluster-containing enzyme
VLLEVTQRCNLACPVCFAAAGRGVSVPAEPSIEALESQYRRLLEVAPGCNVQLSGGEPTTRDDLPEIVALGRAIGHGFMQLNTNGLRLALEAGYTERLAEAGLSTVFLQFDGIDDTPYVVLRGHPLAAVKQRAVQRCAEVGLGVVLVPTVVHGVNLDRLGDILEFALEHAPTVRGVHVQPMALLGRFTVAGDPGVERVTLPDTMRELAAQSRGRVLLEDLTPGDCEDALCSFSREYVRRKDGSLAPLRAPRDTDGCGERSSRLAALAPAEKAARVASRWSVPRAAASRGFCGEPSSSSIPCCSGPVAAAQHEPDQWDAIIQSILTATFTVSGMAFQDAWTLDLDRLRHCYLHVYAADGRLIPFCARYLTRASA